LELRGVMVFRIVIDLGEFVKVALKGGQGKEWCVGEEV
jgi:hypothetical protein